MPSIFLNSYKLRGSKGSQGVDRDPTGQISKIKEETAEYGADAIIVIPEMRRESSFAVIFSFLLFARKKISPQIPNYYSEFLDLLLQPCKKKPTHSAHLLIPDHKELSCVSTSEGWRRTAEPLSSASFTPNAFL